jgi:hypothetical protein
VGKLRQVLECGSPLPLCGRLPKAPEGRRTAQEAGATQLTPCRPCSNALQKDCVLSLHEPNPLIPSFSPSGGEGARRAVEGDSLGSWSQCVSKKWRLSMNRPSERGQPCPREHLPPNSRTRRSALLFPGRFEKNRRLPMNFGGAQDVIENRGLRGLITASAMLFRRSE